MVYIRGGSKGCWTCRDRRIKCDGARPPPCARCLKSNRECRGYEEGKFVHYVGEEPRPEPQEPAIDHRRALTWKTESEGISTSPESPHSSSSTGSPPSSVVLQLTPEGQRRSSSPATKLTTPVETLRSMASSINYPPVSRDDRTAIRFIVALNGPLLARNHLTHGQFANFIPSRVGADPTLDNAVACVNAASFEIAKGQTDLRYSSTFYMRAISNLRKALSHDTTSRSDEVLVATLLLQIYELHTNDQALGMIAHAGGAIRLIEARGPDLHRSGVGKAVLISMQAPIIDLAVRSRRRCFLADEKWIGLMDEIAPPKSGSTRFPQCTADASADLFKCSIHHSGIVESAANTNILELKSSLAEAPELNSENPSLLLLALDQRVRYLTWRDKYVPTIPLPFIVDNEVDPEHDYYDRYQAIFDLPLHMILIVVDCLLSTILPREPKKHLKLQLLLSNVRGDMKLPDHHTLEREIQALTKNISHAYEYSYCGMEGYPTFMNSLLDNFCDIAEVLPEEALAIVRHARGKLHDVQAGFKK